MARPEVLKDLTHFELDPESMQRLGLDFSAYHRVVVLGVIDPEDQSKPVHVGLLDPDNQALLDLVAERLMRPVKPVRLNEYEIKRALNVHRGRPLTQNENIVQLPVEEPGPRSQARQTIDYLLQEAVRRKASDIHIETYFHDVDVRLRIDGILHQQFTHLSPDNVREVITRLKVLTGMDIAERRRPQDGRFQVIFVDNGERQQVDFRLSVVPSPGGEDAVIRVLDANIGLIPLDALGMPTDIQRTFTQLLHNPEGMLLVTGPTGSGKTTTLYASLLHIRAHTRKIITAEDPIEYYIDKINQKEVSDVMSMADLTRALMRQDPDVMLYGEIRDPATGDNAITAAATGHLVLSTLHTADSVGSVVRLRTLGLEDVDIAGAMLGSMAQRLVRRICPHCREPTLPTERQEILFGRLLEDHRYFEGAGCEACYGTGYKGRTGLFELLVTDERLQDMIADGASRNELRIAARRQSDFRTMLDDGLTKIDAGETTLDELMRVLPYRHIVIARQEREQTLAAI